MRDQESRLRERRLNQIRQNSDNQEQEREEKPFPDTLLRRYTIQVVPETMSKNTCLRNVSALKQRGYVQIKGMVTKITDVQFLLVSVFSVVFFKWVL